MKKLQKINNEIKSFFKLFGSKASQFDKFVSSNEYAKLIRLDKPIGTHLALFPALWALGFASDSFLQIFFLSVVFYFTATAVRGAGCIINDLWDIDFDKMVARTKNRPLAAGKLKRYDALKFLVLLLIFPFIVLVFLPKHSVITGIVTIIMAAIYPAMKRYTDFPQVFLGFTFALGSLIAWFAIDPKLSLNPFIVYISAVLWIIAFDTIYGHQDIKDDLRIGVRSMSIYLGDRTPEICWRLYLSSSILILIMGLITHMNILFYLIAALGIYQLYWQTETVDLNNPKDCGDKFRSNTIYGLIILAAILIGKI